MLIINVVRDAIYFFCGGGSATGDEGGNSSGAVLFHACVRYKRQSLNLVNLTDLNSLVSGIQLKWSAFKIMEFELTFTNTTDVVTQASLQLHNNQQTFNITIKSCCLGFSDYANKKSAALDVAGVAVVDPSLLLTDDNVFPLTVESVVENAAEEVQIELAKRARAINLEEACEYTKREFISPLLIAAVCVCNVSGKLISMICEKLVVGKHGRGPIDYALMFKRIFVLLTEAKNTDLEGGQAQNVVQQESCRESLANAFVPIKLVGENRKRKFNEVYNVVRTIPTFGIVTTGRQWRFTKVDHSHDQTMVTTSSTFDLLLDPTADPAQKATQLQNIKAILRRIVGVLEHQMALVNDHTRVKELMESVNSKEVEKLEGAFQEMAEAMDGDNEEEDTKEEEL
jgi:hypothetical protein